MDSLWNILCWVLKGAGIDGSQAEDSGFYQDVGF